MLLAHEPAWLIGADRQDREPKRAMAFARAAEVLSVAIAGISHMEDPPGRRLDDEARPQRLVSIGQAARGPMLHRHQCHSGLAWKRHPVAPVVGLSGDRRIVVSH